MKILLENYTNFIIPDHFDYNTLISVLAGRKYNISLLMNGYRPSPNDTILDITGETNYRIHISNFFFYKNLVKLTPIIKTTFKFLIFNFKRVPILSYNIGNINIGEPLYDSIIRDKKDIKKFRLELSDYRKLFSAILDYYVYKRLFNSENFDVLIVSHLVYSKFLILARIFHYNKKPVILYNGIGLIAYSDFSRTLHYHNIKFDWLEIVSSMNKNSYINRVDSFLKNRFSGNQKQFDVYNSYVKNQYNKNNLSTNRFTESLDISKTIVLIAPHVFKDGPNHSKHHLFDDYYDWFVETLHAAKTNKDVLFLIKPHPSAFRYVETGVVEKLIDSTDSKNILVIPEILKPTDLVKLISATITHSGTIGIELACLGIPTILAGKPFYSDFGFSIEFLSKYDYLNYIRTFKYVSRLDPNQVTLAKTLFFEYSKLTNFIPQLKGRTKISKSKTNNKVFEDQLNALMTKIENPTIGLKKN